MRNNFELGLLSEDRSECACPVTLRFFSRDACHEQGPCWSLSGPYLTVHREKKKTKAHLKSLRIQRYNYYNKQVKEKNTEADEMYMQVYSILWLLPLVHFIMAFKCKQVALVLSP